MGTELPRVWRSEHREALLILDQCLLHCVVSALSATWQCNPGSVWSIQTSLYRKARSVDLMVVDALRHANTVLSIKEKIRDPAQFLTLDDTLLKRIEFWDSDVGVCGHMSQEDMNHMRKAQAVVRRLRLRDLYKFCGAVVVSHPVVDASPSPLHLRHLLQSS